MDENRCTSRNVTVKFPSTKKRSHRPFPYKRSKSRKAWLFKSNIRIWKTLGQYFQNSQEKSFPIFNPEFYNQLNMSKLWGQITYRWTSIKKYPNGQSFLNILVEDIFHQYKRINQDMESRKTLIKEAKQDDKKSRVSRYKTPGKIT